MRILIVAYTCSPFRGSEHAVGWGFINELSRGNQLCVIAEEEKCKSDIVAYLLNHPELSERIDFHFIRKSRARTLRKLWPPSYYYFYRKWHLAAYELAKQLHSIQPFDVVHQLTMVGYREPGYLWKIGIPFVWGPIGGMGLFPWRFMPSLGLYGMLYYTAYNVINYWQVHFSRRPRLAAAAAGPSLMSATPTDQAGTLKHWKQPSHLMAEVGLPCAVSTSPTARAIGDPLRIVWSGLHIPRKALPLGLRALAALPAEVSWTLDILGHGPETASWQRLAGKLGIASKCYFHDWIERDAALKVMSDGHVMLITSLRDLTSTVTVEALSLGMPVVCLDHCGFSSAVDESCGIKIAVTNPAEVVNGLRNALLALNDESLRSKLAGGALKRASMFDWSHKVSRLEDIYRSAMGASPQ